MIYYYLKYINKAFDHLDHFKNYIKAIYSISLRTLEQVAQRRLRKLQQRQMLRRRQG